MSEDVKTLRLLADRFDPKGWGSGDRGELSSAFRNAADLIEHLQQENARLRAGWPVAINCPSCGARHEFHLHPDNDVWKQE